MDIQKAEYERYLRGCRRLGWKPVGEEEFLDQYAQYQYADATLQRYLVNADGTPVPAGILLKFHLRIRKLQHVKITLRHLHTAVMRGVEPPGHGDSGDTGKPDRIQPPPSPKTGTSAVSMPEMAAQEEWRFEVADAVGMRR